MRLLLNFRSFPSQGVHEDTIDYLEPNILFSFNGLNVFCYIGHNIFEIRNSSIYVHLESPAALQFVRFPKLSNGSYWVKVGYVRVEKKLTV